MQGEGRYEIRRQHAYSEETTLGEDQAAASTEDARRMGRITRTRVWMLVLPSTVNGMELWAQ